MKISLVSRDIGLILLLLFSCSDLLAHETSDTAYTNLKEIEIKGYNKNRLQYTDASRLKLNINELMTAERAFGEADAISVIKKMAGVTTAGDYGAGIMIDGMNGSQVLYRISGAPVFYPYRFGGIFSTFNTPHFAEVTFERGVHDASMPTRLGAKLDFYPHTKAGIDFGGVVNVGLLSSSATLKIPIGGKISAVVSGRISYVDQLYGKLLHYGTTDLQYQFHDYNATLRYDINSSHSLDFNLFCSSDNLNYGDSNFGMNIKMIWKNALSVLRWNYMGRYSMTNCIYWSGFNNVLDCGLPVYRISVPSGISTLGAAGDFLFDRISKDLKLSAGYELANYSNMQQSVEYFWGNDISTDNKSKRYHSLEGRLYANVDKRFSELIELDAGISINAFHNNDSYFNITADPRLTLRLHSVAGVFGLHVGKYTQFLHNVGFSDIGLASNFWLTSNRVVPAQTAYAIEFEYLHRFNDIGMTLNANIYYRYLDNQPEYFGQITDLLSDKYDSEQYIMTGSGYNCGINATVTEVFGPLAVSLSVGFGVARRHFPGFSKSLRANSDPGLTINANASYRLSRHWDIATSFIFAEGRPYTPAESLYLIAGNIITEYALPNSARLPEYHRLDISGTWHTSGHIGNRRVKHLVNISLINAYGHRNVDFRKYRIGQSDMRVRLVDVYSKYRFLPSLSYTIEF